MRKSVYGYKNSVAFGWELFFDLEQRKFIKPLNVKFLPWDYFLYSSGEFEYSFQLEPNKKYIQIRCVGYHATRDFYFVAMFLETKEDGTIEELGKAFFGIFSQYPISDKALEDFHKTELFKDLQNYYPSKRKTEQIFKKDTKKGK